MVLMSIYNDQFSIFHDIYRESPMNSDVTCHVEPSEHGAHTDAEGYDGGQALGWIRHGVAN